MKTRAVFSIAAICLLIFSGCTSIPKAPQVQHIPNFSSLEYSLSQPLTYSAELTNASQQVIALYSASYPQFDTSDVSFAAPSRINQVYSAQLEQCAFDSESFFNHCKRTLGDGWETLDTSEPVFTATVDYELSPCLSDYICIYSTYTLKEKTGVSVYPSAQVFLAETGWSLGFSSLFGSNTDKALSLLKSKLEAYCKQNSIPSNSIAQIGEDYLTGSCGFTENTLFVCFDPYFFSSEIKDLNRIDVPIGDFIPLLTEQVY